MGTGSEPLRPYGLALFKMARTSLSSPNPPRGPTIPPNVQQRASLDHFTGIPRGEQLRSKINIYSRHRSCDRSTCDWLLHIHCGSRDDIHLDSRPEKTPVAPSMTDNREWLAAKLSH